MGLRLALALSLGLLAASCTVRTTTGPNTIARPAPSPPGAAGPGVEGEAPLDALNRLDAWLVANGASRLGPAQRNPSLPENRVIAYAIDANAGQCYTVLAFAAASNDLDLVLLGPSGDQVTHDVRADAHPYVSFCATQPGRYIVRVQMARGSGEYYYAVYTSPPGAQPDVASYWGARQSGPAAAEMDPATQARLDALDRELENEGFTRTAPPLGLQLANSQERLFPLQLEPGACYAFATLAGAGSEDTDAALVDGAGREIVQDIRQEADAIVRYCPTQPVAYQLRARLYAGNGAVFTAAWTQARGGQSVPTTPVLSTSSTAGVGVEENFRLLDADMRARGYEPLASAQRGTLAEGNETQFALELEGGKCYAVLAVGDNGVRDLDLQLVDAQNRVIDRDIEVDARPVVRVCPERAGAYQMRVRMYQGTGQFVYATYRWPRGIRGPFGLEGLIYVRLAEVTSLLDVEGYQPDLDAEPGQGSLAREGQERTHRVRLTAGQCYAVLAVGGDGVNDLDLAVTRNGNVVAQDDTHTAFPSVRLCADGTGDYELDLRMVSGKGAYFYQVFHRS